MFQRFFLLVSFFFCKRSFRREASFDMQRMKTAQIDTGCLFQQDLGNLKIP